MLLNRRLFLISSAVFAAGCAVPGGSSLSADGRERTLGVGPAGRYLKDGVYTAYRDRGFFLVRRGAALFALSAVCTHRNCKLDAEADQTFYCPCHGSTFDAEGKVTAGPARRDLPVFEVVPDGSGNLQVKIPAGSVGQR